MKKVLISVVLIFMLSSPSLGCIGARQAAMGWAGVAISDDATVSYWNPANIWAKDGFYWENFGERTALAIKQSNYGFHYVDEWDKTYWRLSYGNKTSNNSAFGISVGWEEYHGYFSDYKGPSADISYIYKKDHFTYAILAQNIGNIRPTIAYQNNFITITTSIYDIFNLCPLRHFQTGIEVTPIPFISFRGGYNGFYEIFTYGIGVKTSFMSLDLVHLFNENHYSITLFY
jgi:hypothetical protein